MANMLPNRFGQVNQAGDPDALFLKVFAGEVLTAFSETNVAASRTMVRTITSGKSASFPASWKGTAAYHVPGTQLLGTGLGLNERILVIDDMLIADRSVAQIDELKTHFDIRSIYSRDIGMALARSTRTSSRLVSSRLALRRLSLVETAGPSLPTRPTSPLLLTSKLVLSLRLRSSTKRTYQRTTGTSR